MPIRPFLEGEAFDPETLVVMGAALAEACKTLGLNLSDDPATRLLAERIVKAARAGVCDLTSLKAAALQGLAH